MTGDLKPSEIFKTLDLVISSPALGPGSRLPALLRYLVVEELEGRGPAIKAFSIAADVLGRGAEFDPQTDSIVRVEVGRLRKALQLYNATDGAEAPWLIEIPKGGYRPLFIAGKSARQAGNGGRPVPVTETRDEGGLLDAHRVQPQPAVGNVSRLRLLGFALALCAVVAVALGISQRGAGTDPGDVPLVVVNPINFSSDTAGYDFIAEGLRADITARLADFRWLAVTQVEPAQLGLAGRSPDPDNVYMINSVVQIAAGKMRIRATLANGARQLTTWSQDYDVAIGTDFAGVFALSKDVADRIAVDIGRPLGPIAKSELAQRERQNDRAATTQDQRYLCMLMFRDYWRSLTPDGQTRARLCLEKIVSRDAGFADGQAALAFITLDVVRSGKQASDNAALLERARAQAAAALALQPDDELPLSATMAVAACSGDQDTVRRKANKLAEEFPFWPSVQSDVGNKRALVLGEWGEGLALIQRARRYNTAPEPWYGLAPALRLILDRRPAEALAGLGRGAQRGFEQGHLVRLAAARLADNSIEMAVAREDLSRLGYANKAAVMALLEAECWSDDIKAALRPAIEDAF